MRSPGDARGFRASSAAVRCMRSCNVRVAIVIALAAAGGVDPEPGLPTEGSDGTCINDHIRAGFGQERKEQAK